MELWQQVLRRVMHEESDGWADEDFLCSNQLASLILVSPCNVLPHWHGCEWPAGTFSSSSCSDMQALLDSCVARCQQ